MLYNSRDLNAEKQAMKDLMATGQYKLENGKNQELEKAIRQKVYNSSTPVFKDKYGLSDLEKKIQESASKYNEMATGSQDYANMYEGALKEQSPEFLGAKRENLMKKYGTEGSADYIENPLARNDIVNQQVAEGQMTLGELLNRAMGVYGAKASQREVATGNLENQYQKALSQYQGDVEQAQYQDQVAAQKKQQDFENQMAMDEYQMAMKKTMGSGGSGGGGRSSGGRSSGGRSGKLSQWETKAMAGQSLQDDIQQAIEIYRQSDPNSNISETQLLPALRSTYGGIIDSEDIDKMFYTARSPYESEVNTRKQANEQKMQSYQEPQRNWLDRAQIWLGNKL